MSLTHIETIELGSSQASITFSSIPQDYDDLIIKVSTRNTNSTAGHRLGEIELNGSSANFSAVNLLGTGSAVATQTQYSNLVFRAAGGGTTANTFGNADIYISNYTASSSKSISSDSVYENNGTSVILEIIETLWSNSAAVTSVTLTLDADNFTADSTFSLYGVTAGGDGTVTTA